MSWNIEKMGRRGGSLLVKCPKCGELGKLYYDQKNGWYVRHYNQKTNRWTRTHKIGKLLKDGGLYLEVPLHKPRLNLHSYMGGDYYLLPFLAKLFPPHKCYVEVFGGAAPLLLNKPPSKVEVYNDIDGNLVNLFRVVREEYRTFLERCKWLLYSREMYYDLFLEFRKTGFRELDRVERAVRYFSLMSMAFNGNLGTRAGFRTSKVRNLAFSFFQKIHGTLSLVHKRLQNVVIENLDFRECIKRYDSELTFFYLDPPHLYFSTEKPHGDFYDTSFGEDDYMDLLSLLETVRGKWLLKQNYLPFIEKWCRENKFRVHIARVFRSASTVNLNSKRSYMKVMLITNY